MMVGVIGFELPTPLVPNVVSQRARLSVTKNLEFSKGGGHGNSDPSRAAEATAPVSPFYAKALAMTERSLQEFFDTLRSAQQANRVTFAEWYDIIERIDRCFVRA